MKPAHKNNAGQIVNTDEKMKLLSDYIKQVQKQETPVLADEHTAFDVWWLQEGRSFYLSSDYTGKALARLAYRAASAPAAPGRQLVPVEPTPRMLTAGGDRLNEDDIKLKCGLAQADAPGERESFDMLAHLRRQAEFSARTFGPGARVEGVTDHIAKELIEVRESGGALSEWVDCIILAFDGAWRSGASPEQIIAAMVAKQTKNEGRTWPDWRTAAPGKAIEHDRSREARTASAPAAPKEQQ